MLEEVDSGGEYGRQGLHPRHAVSLEQGGELVQVAQRRFRHRHHVTARGRGVHGSPHAGDRNDALGKEK